MKKCLIAAALLLALVLSGCGDKTPPVPSETEKPGVPAAVTWAEGKELFALAETEEAAKEIAAQYEIELVSFGEGVAVFHTEEDPRVVVKRGVENGWPLVELNLVREPLSD